jgi:ubiquinone/menaquinone biosynthesis C-methylase UbiE
MEPRPYYSEGGLNVETYDLRTPGFPSEIDFWVARAREAGGPVLELACGTGRITWPIARAGVDIVGLDINPAMLRAAEAKRAHESPDTRERVRLVHGDMADFSLDATFALAIIPFRAFQLLLTSEDQRRSLASIRRHLRPSGRLVIDLFDPRLDSLLPERTEPGMPPRPTVTHPVTGHTLNVDVLSRRNDTLRQVFSEHWRFTERSSTGELLRQEDEILDLRWTYRYEMRYLLELAGFAVEDELSDFRGSPPTYGKEQIWIAAAA